MAHSKSDKIQQTRNETREWQAGQSDFEQVSEVTGKQVGRLEKELREGLQNCYQVFGIIRTNTATADNALEARPLTLLPHKHSCLATQPLLLRPQEFVSLRLNSTAESFKTVFKKKKVLYILGITCVISCSTGHYFVLNIWPKKGHTAKPENCTIFLLVFCSTFHPRYKANVSRSVHFKVSCTEVYSFSTIFLR